MNTELGGTDQLCPRATISTLPDDVLLNVFCFYSAGNYDAWYTLVHVCQGWRHVVFASPRRLDLQLFCTNTRPVKRMLDIWPELPLIIYVRFESSRRLGAANVIAALKQHDRVYRIFINHIPNSLLKKFAAMKKPFPALKYLDIRSDHHNPPVLPDSFLGGSAPRLEELTLSNIPSPGLPKLLLSTRDLVFLILEHIPRSGYRYLSPETIVSCLSMLTKLHEFHLMFRFPRSEAERASRRPPPLSRVIHPTLTYLWFKGDSDYLEDLVSRIDTPSLDHAHIRFFNQLIFDTPLLGAFISRTEAFMAPHRADISFSGLGVRVELFRRDQPGKIDDRMLALNVLCRASDWQLSSIAQICSSTIRSLPTLERLRIYENEFSKPRVQWEGDMEHVQWLELLQPFISVNGLVLFLSMVPFVAPAFEELAKERLTEVLPALRNLFLPEQHPSGAVGEAIEQFIAARRRSNLPVTIRRPDIGDM